MNLTTLLPDDIGGRLPFRRRRSRLERLRRRVRARSGRAAAVRPATTDRRIVIRPEDLGRAAAAARRAVAERTANLDLTALAELRERLSPDRLAELARRPAALVRPRPRPRPSPWLIAAAALAGVAVGIGIGMLITSRRAALRARARELESATDEIKAAWPDITDEDIQRARGSAARLAETIRARTGEDADQVRERLAGMTGTEA
jgi:uncharacterized protein YjbJ (UPF0337 family)